MYTLRHGHDDAHVHDGDRMYTPRRDHGGDRMCTPHRDRGGDRMCTPHRGHDDAHDRDDAQIILRFLPHARERDGLRLHSTDPTVWK